MSIVYPGYVVNKGAPVTSAPQSSRAGDDWELVKKYSESREYGDRIERILAVKKLYPDNLACKHFSLKYFDSLKSDEKEGLLAVVRSGYENVDSGCGAYAIQENDYDRFRPFFAPLLAENHKVPINSKHVNDWKTDGGELDLHKIGLKGDLSMRVRVGRNLKGFPLPGGMNRDNRIQLEQKMSTEIFSKLVKLPEYGGRYYTLTPGHPDFINESKYQELVDRHLMFKDMSSDTYLNSAGISKDWPYGRGCYVSEDSSFVIWVGEEDHLRIMCIRVGYVLNEVFDRLKTFLDLLDGLLGTVKSADLGYVTSCPTNLGTGMRASVLLKLPKLTAGGTDKKAKEVCSKLGLSVRGMGGEHTPIGADGTVDISPKNRFCIKEKDIITALYRGVEQLMKAENAL